MRQLKLIIVAAHIGAWLLFICLILAFAVSGPGNHTWTAVLTSPLFLSFCASYLFIFYFNSFILLPQLYFKRKYLLYFSTALLLFTGVFYLKPFDRLLAVTGTAADNLQPPPPYPPGERIQNRPPPPPGNRPPVSPPEERRPEAAMQRSGPEVDIVSLVLFVMVWSFSLAIQLVKQWQRTQSRMVQAEADKAQAELSFLKAQINPHFLFNTLNNIYAMSVSGSAHTADAVMKLSDIMRYVTDEVTSDFVPLQSEVACVSNYIDLQKLRLNKKTAVHFTISGGLQQKEIAPLILMTFIENVFKYGVSTHEPAPITIRITIEAGTLFLHCQNKIFNTVMPSESTGIGISNTTQRLQHLYPGRYQLKINDEDELYTVQLTLHLA